MMRQSLICLAVATLFHSCSERDVSGSSIKATSDSDKITQIGKGDKLTLINDLNVSANTQRLYYGSGSECGVIVDGCALILNSSESNRVLPKGTELVFSGRTDGQTEIIQCYGNVAHTRYVAEVEGSQTVSAVECYHLGVYSAADLRIAGMKARFSTIAKFEAAPPIPSN